MPKGHELSGYNYSNSRGFKEGRNVLAAKEGAFPDSFDLTAEQVTNITAILIALKGTGKGVSVPTTEGDLTLHFYESDDTGVRMTILMPSEILAVNRHNRVFISNKGKIQLQGDFSGLDREPLKEQIKQALITQLTPPAGT